MKKVAASIRNQIDLLIEEYSAGLSDISDYAQVPDVFRQELARSTLLHIATALESGDETNFIQFIESRIGDLIEKGFGLEALIQAIAVLEDVVMPFANTAKTAKFLWRASAQARTVVSRRTTELLRESEQKFKAVADNLAVGVFIHQAGVLRYVGGEATRHLGYDKPDELLNRPILDFVPEDERDWVADIARRRSAGEPVPHHYEARLLRKDGTVIQVLLYNTLIEYEGQVATQGTFIDISAQKRTEEALRQSSGMLQLVADNIPQSIFWKDRDSVYLGCNRNFARVAGVDSPADIVGKTDRDLAWKKEEADFFREVDQRVMNADKSELRIIEPQLQADGKQAWLETNKIPLHDSNGKVIGILGTFEDITERKQAEEALRTIFNSVHDGIFLHELDGTVIDTNDKMLEMYGVNKEQALTLSIAEDFSSPDNPLEQLPVIWEKVISGQNQLFEWKARRPNDGSVFDAEVFLTKILLRDREVILAAVSDITERKQLQEQIQESLDRRQRQVETSTEVAQEIAAAPALGQLFAQVVDLVQSRFEYYHAHVYSLEDEALVMQEGTGDAGRQMKETGHRIELAAEQSLVARAARSGRPVLAPDVTQEPGWLPNPLLPETKAEIAVPIKLGEQVLGVLDVQNDAVGSLGEEDQLLLLGLCGQIAVAIEHRRAEAEQQRLTAELESEQSTLRAILENLPLGVFVAEVPTGKPLLTNQRAEDMLGRGISPEAGTEELAEVYAAYRSGTEEPYPQVEMPLVRGMGGEITTVDDMEIRRPDGSQVMLQVFGAPIVDVAGQVMASVAIFQDITEQKQAEAELENRLRELNALQRAMSREGWASLSEIGALPAGYLFDRMAVQPAEELWTPALGQAAESKALVPPSTDPNGQDRAAVAPLLVHDETIGALGVYDDPERPLTPDELALVQAVSEQVAQALEGARLFEETQRASFMLGERVKELNCLNEIGREIEEAPPIPELLQWVTERVPPAMQYPGECVVAIEYDDQIYGRPEAVELPAQMAHGLYVSGELLGRIYIAYSQKRDFLDEESALLGGIATRLSSHIEIQRLLESVQRRADRERLVNTISQKIQNTTSVEQALQTAIEELGQAFQSRYAKVQLKPTGQSDKNGQQSNGLNGS